MKLTKPARNAVTAIALFLALAMLAGGGWLLVWYWRTGGAWGGSKVSITPEMQAAIAVSPTGGKQVVPTFFLAGKGSINNAGRGRWRINTGAYQVMIDLPTDATSFDYSTSVQRNGIYAGEELKLMDFAHQLSNDQITERESGESPAILKSLQNSPADWPNFKLKISDSLDAPFEKLWVQYVLAGSGVDHSKLGEQLLQAVHDACDKALPANKKDYDDAAAEVRKILTVDLEKQYHTAITRARAPKPVVPVRPAPAPAPATKEAPVPPLATPPAVPPVTHAPPAASAPSSQP